MEGILALILGYLIYRSYTRGSKRKEALREVLTARHYVQDMVEAGTPLESITVRYYHDVGGYSIMTNYTTKHYNRYNP